MGARLDHYLRGDLDSDRDHDLIWRSRALVVSCVTAGAACLPLVLNQLYGGRWELAVIFVTLGVITLSIPLRARDLRGLLVSGHLVVAAAFLALTVTALFRGGLSSPVPMVLALVPVLAAYLFRGQREVMVWGSIALVTIVGLGAVPSLMGVTLVDRLPLAGRQVAQYTGPLVVLVIVTALTRANFRIQGEATERAARAERERLQLEQAMHLRRAEQMAVVGRLAVGVAHEVNNPLAYIGNNLDFSIERLREQSGPRFGDVLEALEEAMDGAGRIAAVVKQLNAHGRQDEERVKSMRLRDGVEAALRIAYNQLRHRARVRREYAADPVVRADPGRLAQVFLNLLVNAAQALRSDIRRDHEVRIVMDLDERGRARVAIVDTGEGMSAEVLDRVTEPFFTTRDVGQGTGLGLSISDAIVRSYEGALTISSEVGRGTTARVTLPVVDAGEPAASGRGRSGLEAGARRVLLIDDDDAVRRGLARVLPGQVVQASHVREALDELERDPGFDAIVCDVMMPELDGIDFHRALERTHPELLSRLLFLSGGVFEPASREFIREHGVPLLTKPVRRHELVAAIEEIAANDGGVIRGGVIRGGVIRGGDNGSTAA